MIREPTSRPPLMLLVAGAVLLLLTFMPFLAVGHGGILGVTFDNDMAGHLYLAEDFRSKQVADWLTVLDWYPIGPHAFVAALAQVSGLTTEDAFTGVSMAAVVLLGWTSLALLPRLGRVGQLVVSVLGGMPFLVAGYYGQGAFKEVMMAMFVLAVTGELAAVGKRRMDRFRRWLPMAVLLAGVVSIYSYTGLAWPGALMGAAAVIVLAGRAIEVGARAALRAARAEVVPVAIGATALVVLLIPQIPRIVKFWDYIHNPEGLLTHDVLGNLISRLPFFEGMGIWGNSDYRSAGSSVQATELWAAFVIVLATVGVIWSLRRRDWLLPLTALVTIGAWAFADTNQSPYVAAKALMIMSPVLLILAARPLVERDDDVSRELPWGGWRMVAPLLAAVLVFKVIGSSLDALRFSRVGPTHHLAELRTLKPRLGTDPTLFLGNDDFVKWVLAPAHVNAPYVGQLTDVQLRPEKQWSFGQPLDFDSVSAATLNGYRWVIATNSSGGSDPPEQLRPVQRTRNFVLYERTSEIPERNVLAEGSSPAVQLDCNSPDGRSLSQHGGIASIRSPWVQVAGPTLRAGTGTALTLHLTPGVWNIDAAYQSPVAVAVTLRGVKSTLEANMDPPGTRWPVGRVVVGAGKTDVLLELNARSTALTPDTDVAAISAIIATPEKPEQVVPLRQACGKLVDWYRP